MQKTKNIKDFFAEDVRQFSLYDCHRSLPSGIDGLKPAQRKIIFGMLKKFPNQEIKVSIAASGIQEISGYHHGSLEGTLVKMAQKFPGSNNVPFLEDIGQFGSRVSPIAAATRYIFTRLSDSFRKIYLKDDDGILEHLEDDGMSIEPRYYLPIIPTVLLNGADGMGTGFACHILSYNPNDLIKVCTEAIKTGKSKTELIPWYRGYTGNITKNGSQTVFRGTFEIDNTTTLRITELPLGKFTIDYREVLNDLETKGTIKTYVDNSFEERTEFIVTCPRETLRLPEEELYKIFKLTSRDSENITVWNDVGRLKTFETPNALVDWFVGFRLKKYAERREFIIAKLEADIVKLKQRARFIKFYIKNSVEFSKSDKKTIEAMLIDNGFTDIDELLAIKVYSLTRDQITELEEKIKTIEINLETVISKTPSDMYLEDLDNLKQSFKNFK